MLVKLNKPSTKPVQEISKDSSAPGPNTLVTAIGFGSTDVAGQVYPDELYKVDVNVVANHNDYVEAYEDFLGFTVTEDLYFFAGDTEGEKDSCYGDSGGPLYDAATGIQYGITSLGGDLCADPDYPGGYVRVGSYASWIENGICALSAEPPESCSSPSRAMSNLFLGFSKGQCTLE